MRIDSTIAILGGAGKAGHPLVQAALHAGYRVRVLLRHPNQFPIQHQLLTTIPGDARDPRALRQLLTGSTALLSTLGNPRGENVPMLSAVTELLVPLLRELHINRYVTVTTLYATGQPQPDLATQQAADYMQQHFPTFMADRQREFDLLDASALAWTYVRLPRIVEAPPTSQVRTSLVQLPGSQISTGDLAEFLLQQLTSSQFLRQAPFIASS